MESQNRAFMYGESVFTTMRMQNGQVKDWSSHFERLRKGVEYIYGPFTDGPDWTATLKNNLEAKYQDQGGDKVIRLTIFREQERGLLKTRLISISDLKIHISGTPFEKDHVEKKMFKLRTCPAPKRPLWWPSFLKAGNYLETILAQKMYMKPDDDDVLFMSHDDIVLESSVANIFVVRHNKLFTAPAGPNVLEGVMRKKVLEIGKEFFDDCLESETSMEQLIKADAIFGSNSVRGLFLVDRIDEFEITYTQDFLKKFEMMNLRVFS